jgi:hypothetical protein
MDLEMFNWTRLPTELKERVILLCMHKPRSVSFTRRKKRLERKSAPEVTSQLGEWSALLSVSHQVRAITLRLCFVGSSDLAFGAGLCIEVENNVGFKNCIRRLGRHYQMLEADGTGVPVSDKTWALAKTYKQYPKLYPQLKQYATFRHDIRKLCMQMDFLDYLYFFKVSTGGFQQYWKPYLDHEVFDQFPHLNELRIVLPDVLGRLEENMRQSGPQLFYGDPFNCPRILHRLIYEQAAKVLAHHNVIMQGFIDDLEDMRFVALRENAVKALKFTSQELEELYTEDGGGIELEESVVSGVKTEDTGDEAEDVQCPEIVPHAFWPPKCRCEVLCRRVIHPNTI